MGGQEYRVSYPCPLTRPLIKDVGFVSSANIVNLTIENNILRLHNDFDQKLNCE